MPLAKRAERGECRRGARVKRSMLVESVVFVLLVALGAGVRVYFHFFHHWPNFAPVAALSLFAGYYFRSWLVALAAPLVVMSTSDWFIGGYDPLLMGLIYATLACPVLLRGVIRNRLRVEHDKLASSLAAAAGLITCALGSSLLFFVVSNFGWWAASDMYEHSLAGLWRNYVQALPFFRNTLFGDLFFSLFLFGGYALAVNLGWAKEPATELVCEG